MNCDVPFACHRVQTWTRKSEPLIDISHQPLNVSLNGVLTLEAVLNPTNDIQPFVEQILVIEQLQVRQTKVHLVKAFCH